MLRATTIFQWVFVGMVTVILLPPFIFLGIFRKGLTRKGRLFHPLAKTYSKVLYAAFRVRVIRLGFEQIDPNRPYVFMANHTSIADPLALAISMPQPFHCVFKKELARIPVFGWALLSLGQIMVDREDTEQARASIDGSVSGLSGNNSIVIFPEGKISRDGRLLPLKKGGFHLALQAGLPIVPVRIQGARQVCPAGGWGRFHEGVISVRVFPPLGVCGKTEADIPDLVERVRACLA
ncbi:MAG: 1-acyl-sn-glycerol-3-phosphate acyltransferase [Deltaproteobacteria bacterium]|nr:1-acyl-sn-glycerol-3-phosphate acyltransferase [Deltaproteobacteria bacterium]